MSPLIRKVHKYGANANTDGIIAARFVHMIDLTARLELAMEDLDSAFLDRVRDGDFIAAATNFGCGSSREQAPIVIKRSVFRL